MNFSAMLPLITKLPPQSARRAVRALLAADAAEENGHEKAQEAQDFKTRAAAAFEKDMQPVRTALAAALHAGTDDALRGLQAMTVGMLREVNRTPAFAAMLLRGMTLAFLGGLSGTLSPLVSADVRLSEDTLPTDGMTQFAKREVFETDLGSAELRGFSRELKERALFSARTTNAEYVDRLHELLSDALAGKMNKAQFRVQAMRKLAELGYDPAFGFPGDQANIPPAESGSLQDLGSFDRLNLIWETQLAMARNYGRAMRGNRPEELLLFPAWELVRLRPRDTPRGFKRVHGQLVPDPPDAWLRRWEEAREDSSAQESSTSTPMIALKDSPLWQALGDGAGGHTDTLGNPYPPFAFNSGMDWRAVPAAECRALGLAKSAPMRAQLAPLQKEIAAALEKLGPGFKEELLRELREEKLAA